MQKGPIHWIGPFCILAVMLMRRCRRSALELSDGAGFYTASERELKVNSRTLIAGIHVAPPAPSASLAFTRTAGPSASRLFRKKIGLSLKRKFFNDLVTLPFSIKNVPSRVRPV